ncbi:MAG: RNA recognition motif domain-containing protein, partial [Myxococcota bacterium]
MTSSSKVFVGNLNFATTKDELAAAFGEAGEVVDVHIPADRETGRPRGFAFVQFSSPEAAAEAITRFDGQELAGRPLRVSEARERRGGGGGGNGGFDRRGPAPERTYRSRGPAAAADGPPSDFDPGWDRGERFEGGGEEDWGGNGKAGRGRRNKPKGSRRGLRAKKRSL